MFSKKTFGASAFGATVALAVTFGTFTGASAEQNGTGTPDQETSSRGIKNVVLVHGAWADGSSWSKVIPLLEARGLHVVAVQNPLTSFADDVAATQRAIALQDGPVVLVGHSYGGAVITQAGNDPKVAGLVFVAAFAPDEGQSALELSSAVPTPVASELRLDQFGFLTLTPKGIREDFAQDLSDAEKTAMTATQGPTSVAAVGGKVTAVAWKVRPTWYIVARHDRTISPDYEQLAADTMNATTIALSSSHVAMLARPYEVAAFIRKAAAEAGER